MRAGLIFSSSVFKLTAVGFDDSTSTVLVRVNDSLRHDGVAAPQNLAAYRDALSEYQYIRMEQRFLDLTGTQEKLLISNDPRIDKVLKAVDKKIINTMSDR